MTRRALAPVVVGFVTLLLAACVSPSLRRPVILGASASAGVGAEVSYRDRPVHVDLESVLLAALARRGATPVMLADPSFYVDPEAVALEQIEAAVAARPTVVVAVDYLFWSVHGPAARFGGADEGEAEGEGAGVESGGAGDGGGGGGRLEALERWLGYLDRLEAPVIVGDIPDMSASGDLGMPASWLPPAEEIAAANARVRAWASQREHVVLLALSELAQASAGSEREGESGGGGVGGGGEGVGLLQADKLHPTAAGLVSMCVAALGELESRGVIKRADFHADEATVLERLPLRAWRVEKSRRGGPLAMLRLMSLSNAFSEAIDAKDCDRAARIGQELIDEAAALRTAPHDMAGIGAWFTLMSYGTCPDARTNVLRWREQLWLKVRVSQPDPWPLELWSILNDALGEERRTLERLLEVQREVGDLAAYEDVVRDMYREFVRTAPVEVMLLFPDVQGRVDELNEDVAKAFEKSKRPIERDRWLAAMEDVRRESGRMIGKSEEEIEQEIRDMYDPLVQLENDLLGLAVKYAELERALVAAGRGEEAGSVRAAAEAGIGPERYAAGWERLEAEILKAAEEAEREAAVTP